MESMLKTLADRRNTLRIMTAMAANQPGKGRGEELPREIRNLNQRWRLACSWRASAPAMSATTTARLSIRWIPFASAFSFLAMADWRIRVFYLRLRNRRLKQSLVAFDHLMEIPAAFLDPDVPTRRTSAGSLLMPGGQFSLDPGNRVGHRRTCCGLGVTQAGCAGPGHLSVW